MICSTCDHTMHGIGHAMYHCPRCGTLAGCYADGSVTVPALVERCRAFGAMIANAPGAIPVSILKSELHRLGVAEAIHKPADRPGRSES